MPENIQKKIIKALSKPPRFRNGVYEKRIMINGVAIYGSAATVDVCERRFLNDFVAKFPTLAPYDPTDTGRKKKVEVMMFSDWAETWFTKIYRGTVLKDTYDRQYKTYVKHILPFFENLPLRDVSFLNCSEFFHEMRLKDIDRTTETCYGVLSRVFSTALEEGLIEKNPMQKIKPVKGLRKNGIPLTKEEEETLLNAVRGSDYECFYLVSLYAGLRPCELTSAHFHAVPGVRSGGNGGATVDGTRSNNTFGACLYQIFRRFPYKRGRKSRILNVSTLFRRKTWKNPP